MTWLVKAWTPVPQPDRTLTAKLEKATTTKSDTSQRSRRDQYKPQFSPDLSTNHILDLLSSTYPCTLIPSPIQRQPSILRNTSLPHSQLLTSAAAPGRFLGPSQLLPQHISDPPEVAPKPTITAVTLLCPAKGSCAEPNPCRDLLFPGCSSHGPSPNTLMSKQEMQGRGGFQ